MEETLSRDQIPLKHNFFGCFVSTPIIELEYHFMFAGRKLKIYAKIGDIRHIDIFTVQPNFNCVFRAYSMQDAAQKLKASANRIGESLNDAKTELDRRVLRPVFKEDLY